MTIKFRSRLIFVLIFISMALLISNAVLSFIGYKIGSFSECETFQNLKFQNIGIFKYRLICPVISVFVFLLYTLVSLIVVGVKFEKSQSSEIIFLTIFFIGCFLESSRLFFPLLNLWTEHDSVATLSTRIALAGRTIAILSILFSSLYSKASYRQYIERNILIIIVLGIIFGIIYPLNSSINYPSGRLGVGFPRLFAWSECAILLLGIISLVIDSVANDVSFMIPLGMFFISCGYLILSCAYNIFLLSLGSVLLVLGTILYLNKLHSIYLWND